jgi:hypothetical protein
VNVDGVGNYVNDFVDDLIASPALRQYIVSGDYAVAAWRAAAKHKKIRTHIASLNKIAELLHPSILSKIPGGEEKLMDILKAAKNQLEDGTASKLVKLADHLENIKQFAQKFGDRNPPIGGYEKVFQELATDNPSVQDGITHALNVTKDIPAEKVKSFDMKFEDEGMPCQNCRFDVETTDGSPKFYEFKSYSDAARIPVPQFLNYLASITSFDQLKYVFNLKKLTKSQAISGMKEFLKANAGDVFTNMKPELRASLGIDELSDLTDAKLGDIAALFVDSK